MMFLLSFVGENFSCNPDIFRIYLLFFLLLPFFYLFLLLLLLHHHRLLLRHFLGCVFLKYPKKNKKKIVF